MVTGKVNRSLAAVVRLPIQDAAGNLQEIDAILDTGFNGSLAIPRDLVEELGLPARNFRSRVVLASGEERSFAVFAGHVLWDGTIRRVLVDAGGPDVLIGMGLLEGYDIHAHMVPGGTVSVVALPSWNGGLDSKEVLLRQAGVLKDDEFLDDLLNEVYKARGRPEVE